MPNIQINTEDVRNNGTKFAQRSSEVKGLIDQAKQMMNSLQSTFTGNRAKTIFEDWEAKQNALTNAVQTIKETGDFLTKAADEFENIDSSM